MANSGDEAFVVSFHGVRGSTPCSCPELQRYGGNTSCVALESPDRDPIVFDLGTGLRMWGRTLNDARCTQVHALVTHLHWDHIQGLPFFAPVHRPEVCLDIYGPAERDETLGEAFRRFMNPPFFPIQPDQLIGDVEFHDVANTEFDIQDARVTVRSVPHTGTTNGYRVERGGVAVAYVPDHQQPAFRRGHVAESVLELCRDVDVLIHDCQFTPEELVTRSDWGHCTPAYAVEVARQSGARSLLMFHHDPGHDDAVMDRLAAETAVLGAEAGLEVVIAASEGMRLSVGRGPIRPLS